MNIIDLMKYCRLPLYFKSEIRSMKVGDVFLLGIIKEFYEELDLHAVAEAWIEKERGVWKFYAAWTLPTNSRRTDVMTDGKFIVKKGGVVEFFDDSNRSSLKSFALVCRRIQKLLSHVDSEERQQWFDNGLLPYLNGIRVNSENTTYRTGIVRTSEENKICRVKLPPELMPTPSLEAILNKAMFLGVVDFDEKSHSSSSS